MAELVSPLGARVTVSDAEAPTLLSQGYRQPSEDEQRAARLAAEREEAYGGLGGGLVAAGVGMLASESPTAPTVPGLLLDIATGPVGQFVAPETSGELRSELAQYLEENPGSAIAGQVAPAVGGALLSGGSSLAGAAASGARSTLGGLARGAVAGGLEAGLQNVTTEQRLAQIKNEALTAEQLVSQFGIGFAFGAVGGGVEGALARRVAAPSAAALQTVAGNTFGSAAPGIGERALRVLDAPVSAITGAERGTLASLATPEARRIAVGADQEIAGHTDEFFEALAKARDVEELVAAQFSGGMKADQIGKIIKTGNEAETVTTAHALVSDLRAAVDDMIAAPSQYDVGKWLTGKGRLRDQLEHLDARLSLQGTAAGAGVGGTLNRDVYMQLDGLKRAIGKRAMGYADRGVHGMSPQQAATWRRLQSAYDDSLRPALESVELWGDAATAQRAINEPWKALLDTKLGAGPTRGFEAIFTTKTRDWQGAKWVVDRKKVGQFLEGITNPDESEALKTLDDWATRNETFVKTAKEYLDLDPALASRTDELGSHMARLRGARDRVVEAATLRNQLKKLDQADSAGSMFGSLIGTAIGTGVLGPLGGVAAATLGAAMHPGASVRKIAAIEALVGKHGASITRKTKALMRGAVRVPTRGAVPAARDKYEQRERELRASTPSDARRRAEHALSLVGSAAPGVITAAGNVAERRHAYLLKLLPPKAVPTLGGRTPRINPEDVRKLLAADRALDNPASILDDLLDGHVSHEGVKAVKAVYPEQFASMQRQLADEMSGLAAQGEVLPYAQRVRIGLAFDLPTDPSLEPAAIRMAQQAYATAPAQPPAGGGGGGDGQPSPLAKSMQTSTDKLEEI